MNKKILWIALLVILHTGCQKSKIEESSEIESLKSWISKNNDDVKTIANKSFATKELTKEQAELATKLIHKHQSNYLKNKYQDQWGNKALKIENHTLKFKYKKFGKKPAKGWSLYISMHGGGATPAEVNNQQWNNQIDLYKPDEGIYMAPRAPTDSWNMWHQSDIDDFFSLFIELADIFEDINLNRVYLTGYSAGGDGVYQLAPRMADRFAAAATMAGHPNDASPLGLRNLPFTLHMGGNDDAFNRNTIAAEWDEQLNELQNNDPKGYIHNVQIHEGKGHWMDKRDTVAILWIANFERKDVDKIVWKQSSRIHNRFYWLGIPDGTAQQKSEITATLNKQEIIISDAKNVNTLLVCLNDKIADLDKPIRIEQNGNILFDGKAIRTIEAIANSISQRNDTDQLYYSQIEVSLK
jgi:predicted peptidase